MRARQASHLQRAIDRASLAPGLLIPFLTAGRVVSVGWSSPLTVTADVANLRAWRGPCDKR